MIMPAHIRMNRCDATSWTLAKRQIEYMLKMVSMFANNTDVMIIAMGGSVAHSPSHRKD